MYLKLFIVLAITNFSACSIQAVQESQDVENLLNNKKDKYLYNELYGHKKERFLRNQDFARDELHEDQDNTDVYKGMTFAKLGQDTLNFHQDSKQLESQLQNFRRHTDFKLIPSELLSAANNVYIANAQFLQDKRKLHLKKERLLEGESRQSHVKKIRKQQRERELAQMIENAKEMNQQVDQKKDFTIDSLDFDLDEIYNLSQDDMKNFAKGLLKK